MEIKDLTGILVVAMVGCILVAGFIPVLNNTVDPDTTFINVGRYYVTTELEDDVTITMNYDIDGTTRQWYIDGDLLTYEPTTTGPEYAQITTVTGTDNWVFRTDGRYRGLTSGTGASDYTLTVTNADITLGGITGNAPLFVATTKEADYVLSNDITHVRYVKGDSELIACGYTSIGVKDADGDDPAVTTNAVISFTGSIDDGFDINVYDTSYTFTVDNIVVNATAHSGYIDLYDFTSVEFDTVSEYGVTTHCTYSVLAVPASVTAEKAIHADDSTATMIALLPLILIMGIVVMFVGVVLVRRYV